MYGTEVRIGSRFIEDEGELLVRIHYLGLERLGSSVLTTVCGISSRLVQGNVVPATTASVAGVKLKLSIFPSVVPGCVVLAAMFGDPVNNSPNATITAVAKPAIHTVFVFIIVFPITFAKIDLLSNPCVSKNHAGQLHHYCDPSKSRLLAPRP